MVKKAPANGSKIYWLLFLIASAIFISGLFLYFSMPRGYEVLDRVKPVTIMQYSGFLAFAFLLQITKPVFRRLSPLILNLLIIFSFLFVMATFFETIWAFNYWFSNYELSVLEGNPKTSVTLDDEVYVPSAVLADYILFDTVPLNLSSKTFTLLLMTGIYFIFYLSRLKNKS